jgi:hypothetical protein
MPKKEQTAFETKRFEPYDPRTKNSRLAAFLRQQPVGTLDSRLHQNPNLLLSGSFTELEDSAAPTQVSANSSQNLPQQDLSQGAIAGPSCPDETGTESGLDNVDIAIPQQRRPVDCTGSNVLDLTSDNVHATVHLTWHEGSLPTVSLDKEWWPVVKQMWPKLNVHTVNNISVDKMISLLHVVNNAELQETKKFITATIAMWCIAFVKAYTPRWWMMAPHTKVGEMVWVLGNLDGIQLHLGKPWIIYEGVLRHFQWENKQGSAFLDTRILGAPQRILVFFTVEDLVGGCVQFL